MTNGPQFTDEMWTSVCTRLSHILQTNTPAELFRILENSEPTPAPTRSNSVVDMSSPIRSSDSNASISAADRPTSTPTRSPNLRASVTPEEPATLSRRNSVLVESQGSSQKVVTPSSLEKRSIKTSDPLLSTLRILKGKSTVRLGLIETLNEIAFTHYSALSTAHLTILLDSLEGCYQFSLITNSNTLLVNKIARTGLTSLRNIDINIVWLGLLDLLLRIEITAISCYLRVLFRMYAEKSKDSEQRIELAEGRLIMYVLENLV